ncbi:ribonuclease P subunit RPR2 [Babesia microti strain RI]|uniref:Ribonuclease P subunit RPR2 n=1 Tax=Babesia microti (strain RI) TaxID=1133968 RepID=I7IA20_BABMR|nr:ribonuclease P subunit RPR2 [Babesia microti strain RI]CCF76004.1 ribonuclease P subunit RPR2 [Babesia microti strain RI]|eukprot:XP_012650412.1 ribonuclease P subunit RPR2 [Babesia microti strain RI]
MVNHSHFFVEGNNIANKCHVQRINYLIQAAALVNNFDNNLARIYVRKAIEYSRKHLLRLDVSVKRYLCKFCHTLLSPALTSTISFKEDIVKINNIKRNIIWTVITCHICKRTRKYPAIGC